MVEARVSQVQPERVLPVNPSPPRIRCLSIRKRFHELQHRNKSQPTRSLSRLTATRKQRRKLLVLIHAAQHISDAQACTPFRERRQSYAARLVRNPELLLRLK